MAQCAKPRPVYPPLHPHQTRTGVSFSPPLKTFFFSFLYIGWSHLFSPFPLQSRQIFFFSLLFLSTPSSSLFLTFSHRLVFYYFIYILFFALAFCSKHAVAPIYFSSLLLLLSRIIPRVFCSNRPGARATHTLPLLPSLIFSPSLVWLLGSLYTRVRVHRFTWPKGKTRARIEKMRTFGQRQRHLADAGRYFYLPLRMLTPPRPVCVCHENIYFLYPPP